MTSIEDGLEALIKTTNQRMLCPVARLLMKIDQEEGSAMTKKVKAVLNEPVYSAERLAMVLRSNGYRIAKGSITHHRNGGCTCT